MLSPSDGSVQVTVGAAKEHVNPLVATALTNVTSEGSVSVIVTGSAAGASPTFDTVTV